MKYWLIEVIHNLDGLCNIGFWLIAIIMLLDYAKSYRLKLVIHPRLFYLWVVCALGVLLIPTEATLHRLLA